MESPATETELFTFLDSLNISYQTFRHPPVFTVEEAQAVRAGMPGDNRVGHSKNLFLKDKRDRYALIVVEENRSINLKTLAGLIGLGRPSFASAERLKAYLGVDPGSVTPFALLNIHSRRQAEHPEVSVVLDAGLMASDLVFFHPLHNAATIAVQPEDLLTFINACGFEPLVTRL